MTEIKKNKEDARSAFYKKDYALAFQTLWKIGIPDFLSYAQKVDTNSRKTNWLTHPDAGNYFWNKFLVEDKVFKEVFLSGSGDQFLHCYFSKCNVQSVELETKLAMEFPDVFVKAVRTNQVFLKRERLDLISSLAIDGKFQLHQKVWKKLPEIDLTNWKGIEGELMLVTNYSLIDILCHCVIWLEMSRFKSNSHLLVYHLGNVYSFFIELVLNSFPQKCREQIETDQFFIHFSKIVASIKNDQKVIEESSVSKLLGWVSHWIEFNEQIISPYSFDLNTVPVQEDEIVFLSSTPESYYNWIVNGVRYEINQLNYFLKGGDIVELLESKGMKIPKGKYSGDENLNRNLAYFKWGTKLFLTQLGIDFVRVGNDRVEIQNLLGPLLSYSFNRHSRYEQSLKMYSETSNDWFDVFFKLMQQSMTTNVMRDPYLLTTSNDYKKHNQQALPEMGIDKTEEILQLFSYAPNSKYVFNRFNIRFDVWQKPFTRMGDNYFCPMVFFANNSWFYSFTQTALFQITDRNETRRMENQLGEVMHQKGWKVKVIDDNDANQINGDVDVIVEDESALLFIQLKRTYFRLNPKDAYYEYVNTDSKAAQQLNDADIYLKRENLIYNVGREPEKWIVSTSFEGIGNDISGCRKVNFFELISALQDTGVKELNSLIVNINTDKNLRDLVSSRNSNDLPIEVRQMLNEILNPLDILAPRQYKKFVFSEDKRRTEEDNELFSLAENFAKAGKLNEALVHFRKYVSQKPNDGDGYAALAGILADMGLFENSIIAYEKAIELLPNDPRTLRDMAITLLDAGRFYDGLLLATEIFERYSLLGDLKMLFTETFKRCLVDRLLKPEEVIKLQNKWSSMS
jgi:tetratricopeptide (TPR) repeat protein